MTKLASIVLLFSKSFSQIAILGLCFMSVILAAKGFRTWEANKILKESNRLNRSNSYTVQDLTAAEQNIQEFLTQSQIKAQNAIISVRSPKVK